MVATVSLRSAPCLAKFGLGLPEFEQHMMIALLMPANSEICLAHALWKSVLYPSWSASEPLHNGAADSTSLGVVLTTAILLGLAIGP